MKKGILITLIVVVAIVLIILGIVFLTPKTEIKYTNFDNNIRISNKEYPTYYDTIIQRGLQELGISNINIAVVPIEKSVLKEMDDSKNLHGYVKTYRGNYYIHMNEVGKRSAVQTLAHELIHVKQSLDGDIEILYDPPRFIYKGEEQGLEDIDYNLRPWEIEAFKEGRELEKKILN